MESSTSTNDTSEACRRQQALVAELGERALVTDDVEEFSDDVVAAAADALGVDRCGVIESLPDGDEGYLVAGSGWPDDAVGSETASMAPETHIGETLRSTEPVVATDRATAAGAAERPSGSGFLARHDVASAVGARIGPPDDPWGVLGVYERESREFSDGDVAFLRSLATVLASAIEIDRSRGDIEEAYGRISDAVFALDDEWRFTYLNDHARETFAPEGRDLVGTEIWSVFPDAADQGFKAEYERAMREREPVAFEKYYPAPIDARLEVRAYPSDSGLSVYVREVNEADGAGRPPTVERDIFGQGPAIVFRWRNEAGWPVEYVSENVEDAFGYAPAELESGEVPYTDLLLEEELDRITSEVEANSDDDTEQFSHDPYRIECKDGEVRWVKDVTTIVRDDAGEITHYLGYLVDITERKERERELERYETVVETMTDGVYVTDDDDHFTMVNEAYAELTGYDREELVGEHTSLVVDEETMADAQRTERAMRDGEAEEPVLEAEVETASGERVPMEARFALLPEGDGDGPRVGVVRDVSERVAREQELERYERIIDNLPVGVYRNTPGAEGEFVAANERLASIFDADSVEELTDHRISDFYVDSEQRAAFSDRLEREGMVENVELRQRTLDGEARWISVTAIRVEEDGEVYFDGIIQDVSERKERERELERTERRFEAIFEDPNILVGLLEPDGTVLDINGTAMEYIDADLADVRGEPFWETPWWGEGDDVPPDVMEWTERAADGEYVDFETDLTRPDGSRYTLNGSFRPVTNDDGEVVSVIVSDRDVTERREYERQLEESEHRYRTLAEHFPNGIVTLFDGDLRYELAAGQAFANLPIDPGDVEGSHFSAVWGEDIADDLEPIFEATLDGEERSIELEYAGREWVVHAVPLTDERGRVFAGMTMAQDITERKEREQELAKYETIVETINDGIYVKDEDGYFTMVNEAYAELTGYDRAELVGEHASLVVDEEILTGSQDLHAESTAGRSTDGKPATGQSKNPTMEAEIQRADGDTIPTEGTFASIETDDERESIGVVRDITERKARRRRIEESERRYRTLIENFPSGAVGLFDEDMEYTAVGGELVEAAGVDVEDRIGNSVYDIYPDEVVAEVEPHFHAALEGEANSFEVDYHGRHLFAHTLPVEGDDGEIFAGMLVVQDVTERREAQQDLRESEARFRMLAENVEEIVWMAAPDGEKFIYVNPAFEGIWGIDREEIYDDSIAFLEAVHPADRERVREGFESLPEERFDDEFRIVRPDGGVRWVHARGAKVQDEDAEMVRIVGTGQDVTERVRRERELERVLDLLERTERIADVGGWEIDPETEDVFWSEHLFDLLDVEGDEEPSLDGALDMYHEEDKPFVEEAVDEALESGDSFDVEVRMRTGGGRSRWLRLQGAPETVDGEVVSLRGAAQDVTERKHREQRLEELVDELEESNERLEQFAYAASHDLQEPLRMVSSYLQLIEDRYVDALDEDGEEFLEFAVDGADRMRDMIDALLEYSRVDTRGDPFEPVDLDEAFGVVREDLQVAIEAHDARIEATSLPTVEADAEQVRQVFQNLVENAIEYSGEQAPRIHVSAADRGDEWAISVRDEGVGIDPDDADRVFEVFESLHSGGENPGTGVGLALCERIVERHGGDIWVESEPGDGSTFTFTLPAMGETNE